eukprot:8898912-Alexandrium_andersonii.AAC.1
MGCGTAPHSSGSAARRRPKEWRGPHNCLMPIPCCDVAEPQASACASQEDELAKSGSQWQARK